VPVSFLTDIIIQNAKFTDSTIPVRLMQIVNTDQNSNCGDSSKPLQTRIKNEMYEHTGKNFRENKLAAGDKSFVYYLNF
jgi:hypothetical protein